MGREGKHDVIIPDILCSKYHLKFDYDIKQQSYTCVDLGSRNGTILNGQRMSNSKQESGPTKLDHGSVSEFLCVIAVNTKPRAIEGHSSNPMSETPF